MFPPSRKPNLLQVKQQQQGRLFSGVVELLSSTTLEKGKPQLVNEKHPSFELAYCMLVGINHAVVETFAKRASREEELDLNYSIPQICLLPRDFEEVHCYTFKRYIHR